MQDLMIDIFILCMIATEQGPDIYTHSYGVNDVSIFRHRVNKDVTICSAFTHKKALMIKNHLESVINGGKGDESIWE